MVSHVKIRHSIQSKKPTIKRAIGKNKNLFIVFIFRIPLTWFYLNHITNIQIYLHSTTELLLFANSKNSQKVKL